MKKMGPPKKKFSEYPARPRAAPRWPRARGSLARRPRSALRGLALRSPCSPAAPSSSRAG